MRDMERMGAREWRDETISSPRRLGKMLRVGLLENRRKLLAAMSDGDAGPYAEDKPCTCHPDDNPPVPCAGMYALDACRKVAGE